MAPTRPFVGLRGVDAVVDFNRDVHCLLGLPFDAVTLDQAVDRVRGAAADRLRCFLSTPNLSFLNSCLDDRRFRQSVINSDLSIADGMPLVLVALLLGIPIPERVPGAGVFEALRGDPHERMSVYFFGGPEGVAAEACRRLNAEGSGLICVGYECPGFGPIEDMSSQDMIDRINASGADFLVVALGAKKGQAWIERNRARITVPVISHLGAVVNFAAGAVKRAPYWVQRIGLEWLWRIKEEPVLWRRYVGDGLALIRLLATRVLPHAWYLRNQRRPVADLKRAAARLLEEREMVIHLEGAWDRGNLTPLRQCFANAVQAPCNIRLDLRDVSRVDSAFVGLVVLLHGHQASKGLQLLVGPLRQDVRRVFEFLCAEYLLA